jgi:hypothetical protein
VPDRHCLVDLAGLGNGRLLCSCGQMSPAKLVDREAAVLWWLRHVSCCTYAERVEWRDPAVYNHPIHGLRPIVNVELPPLS